MRLVNGTFVNGFGFYKIIIRLFELEPTENMG